MDFFFYKSKNYGLVIKLQNVYTHFMPCKLCDLKKTTPCAQIPDRSIENV